MAKVSLSDCWKRPPKYKDLNSELILLYYFTDIVWFWVVGYLNNMTNIIYYDQNCVDGTKMARYLCKYFFLNVQTLKKLQT